MADPLRESYDEVPYESSPVPEAHPEVLAVTARLMGLHPPAVERCRVLELGCAAGGNLFPMALALPEARFVGVDLSPRQVADGQKVVDALGLSNLRLLAADLRDLDASFGTFDYILCHGVFSWVPGAVREKVLSVCRENLAPCGVAFVSYNTYPGWHLRGLFRDLLSYGTRRSASPGERVERARALLPFLADAVGDPEGIYGRLLRHEAELLSERPDAYVFHEHLEEVNQPLHVHDFIEMAGRHGLRFLGEARLANVAEAEATPRFRAALSRLADDPAEREQYLDYLLNRTFRRSLLVHEGASRHARLSPDAIAELHVESDVAAAPGPGRFTTREGADCRIGDPALLRAMEILDAEAPGGLPFGELAARLGLPDGPGPFCRDVLALSMRSLVDLRTVPTKLQARVSATPRAYRLARLQALSGITQVTTPRHRTHDVGEFGRIVLARLDGTPHAQLTSTVAAEIGAGDFDLQIDGRAVSEPADIRTAVGEMLPGLLQGLARAGLLDG